MIIQNTNQAGQPVRRVSDDAPKVVVDISIARPTLDDAVKTRPPSAEQLKQATDTISQVMRQSNQSLELEFKFSVDADTKKPIVRVVDATTGKLVRQIPTEATLAIAHSIDQFQKSLLFSQKV
jgi:flagellar protein FlaG